MIPGIVAGQMSAGVQFVAASGTTYVTATSQDQTIPAATAVGDLLLACVMHRDTLTPPAGWTLVATRACSGAGVTQYTSVYRRVAQSGDVSAPTTWGQASAARMAVHIQAYRKAGGCSVLATATAGVSDTATTAIAWAGLTVPPAGQMAVLVGSITFALTPGTTTITASSGTMTTPPTVEDNRLACAYLRVSEGQVIDGSFDSNNTLAEGGTAAVTLVIG